MTHLRAGRVRGRRPIVGDARAVGSRLQIVERAVVDPTPSFDEIFVAEFNGVERTVFLIVHDREVAKELTQDAFVALLNAWRKVSGYERPGAWVRRVAIRLAVRALRRQEFRSYAERWASDPPDRATSRDLDVWHAIRSLPPKQRAAVVLFYFEDRSVSDVADMLGCSPATTRVHLFRARQRLGELLSATEVDR
jgi:RNA polymerase sigma factor (sigma-70 family)